MERINSVTSVNLNNLKDLCYVLDADNISQYLRHRSSMSDVINARLHIADYVSSNRSIKCTRRYLCSETLMAKG